MTRPVACKLKSVFCIRIDLQANKINNMKFCISPSELLFQVTKDFQRYQLASKKSFPLQLTTNSHTAKVHQGIAVFI